MKLNIRKKIIIYTMMTTIVFYLMVVGYLLNSLYQTSYKDALIKIEQEAESIAKSVSIEFENSLTTARTLAQAFTIYRTMPEEEWTKLFISMYTPILELNPHIFYIWDSWEYNKYRPGYTKNHGRLVMNLRREDGKIISEILERDLDGDGTLYSGLKRLNHETVMEPYLDEGPASEQVMVVSYIAPIQINAEYCGLVGLDANMASLQNLIVKANTIKGGYATLVSHGGIIAGHPRTALIGKHINNVIPQEAELHRLQENIAKGRKLHYLRKSNKGDYVVYWSPVNTLKQVAPWSVAVVVPYDSIFTGLRRTLIIAAIISALGLLLITIGALLVSNSISRPIAQMTQSLNRLADGEMSSELTLSLHTGDELEEMSQALNTSLQGLNNKAQFAGAIGEGRYDTALNLLSERDALGKSLLQMRDSLQRASQEEAARRHEAQIAAWTTAGQAKLGELLRQHSDDLQHLCDDVVGELVRYLGANQGALFLLSDTPQDDGALRHFEMMAAYAWDRRKHMRRTVEEGEGLVGACALERAPIYMTDVPPDYITIGSGLGQANPRCILLVPLLSDNQVVGVFELASFRPLEPHEVEFVERACAGVAGTIIGVRMNARTRELLEQSQMQAEEMRAQEEEMRQNLEELQATQEEVARKTEENEGLVNAIQVSSFVVEYDLNGNVTNINDAYLTLTGLTRADVIGKHHSDRLHMSPEQLTNYTKFWDDLRAGYTRKQRTKVDINGRRIPMLEVYIPVKDAFGQVQRVMKLAYEYSEFLDGDA